MTAAFRATPDVEVTVRGFVGEDALFRYVQRCAAEARSVLGESGWRVTIGARPSLTPGGVVYEVTIQHPSGGVALTHEDAHPYTAVRDALARLVVERQELDPSGCPWRACGRM